MDGYKVLNPLFRKDGWI